MFVTQCKTLETTFEEFVHMTPVKLKFEYRNNDIVSVSMPEQQLEEPEQQQVEPEKQQVELEQQQVTRKTASRTRKTASKATTAASRPKNTCSLANFRRKTAAEKGTGGYVSVCVKRGKHKCKKKTRKTLHQKETANNTRSRLCMTFINVHVSTTVSW